MKYFFVCVLVLLAITAFTTIRADDDENAKLIEARSSQGKVDELTSKMMDEMSKLEQATHKQKVPLMQTRNNILKSIKGFWGRVIETHPSHINWFRAAEDKEILSYLKDISVTDLGEGDHQMHKYRISFEFNPNPFFSDPTLWREVHGAVEENQQISGVHWISGKEPTTVSFFSFFEDADVRKEQKLDIHLMNDVAHVIRYEFWPNPFTYHDLPNYNDYINHDDVQQFSEGEHTHEMPPPPADQIEDTNPPTSEEESTEDGAKDDM